MTFPNFALHAKPVNRVASRVTFGESEAWTPKMKPCQTETFEAPPLPMMQRPPEAPDYSGFRRGYMVALRYHDSNRSGNGASWLCRCDCGMYELRRVKRWMEKADKADSCRICAVTFERTRGYSMGASDEEIRASLAYRKGIAA